MTDLASLTADHFEALLGDEFLLAGGEGARLRLSEVGRQGQALRPGGAFTLTFHGPGGPALPQAIYAIEHAALGRQELFLVPLGPHDDGNAYEAVFS